FVEACKSGEFLQSRGRGCSSNIPIGVKLSRVPRQSASGRRYSSEWTAWEWNSPSAHSGESSEALVLKACVRPCHAPAWEPVRAALRPPKRDYGADRPNRRGAQTNAVQPWPTIWRRPHRGCAKDSWPSTHQAGTTLSTI